MIPNFYIHPDIHQAETLPAHFYRDPEVFEALKERIFLKSWQWIGHENLIPLSGSVYPFSLLPNYLEEPLLLVRDQQSQVHLPEQCLHPSWKYCGPWTRPGYQTPLPLPRP